MKIPANVKVVTAFKCEHEGCTSRLFAHAATAGKHAKACIHNPQQRTCATCDHDAQIRHGFDLFCHKGVREEGVKLQRNCASWEQRQAFDDF